MNSNRDLMAKRLGISKQALSRLIGSARALLNKEGEPLEYEVGLRLEPQYLDLDLTPGGLSEDEILETVKLYSQTCPAVYNWLCSGGFDPTSPPQTVTPALLIHGARTAGRLRAEILRSHS